MGIKNKEKTTKNESKKDSKTRKKSSDYFTLLREDLKNKNYNNKSKNDCIYFLENKKLKEEIEALKKQLLTRMIS